MRSPSPHVADPARVPAHRHSRRRPLTAVAASAVLLSLLAGGCRVQDSSEATGPPTERVNTGMVTSDEKPVMGGTVAYGLAAESNGWNPALNQWVQHGWQVARTLFDPMTAFDEKSEIHPYFATSIEHSEDFKTWTFTIRPDVKFSDGSPADAQAVAESQNVIRRSPVVGSSFESITKIEYAAPDKVVYTSSKPWANFPALLAAQVGTVAEPKWLASNDGIKPVGTGPFRLDSWSIGKDVIVRKNPEYWRMDKWGNRYPYLDSIDFRVVTEGSARAAALDAGDVDIAQLAEPDLIKRYQEQTERFQVFTNSQSEMTEALILVNSQAAPFDNPDARKALAYATDKKAFVDVMAAGLFETASGPFAKNSPWYTDPGYPEYDPAEAKQLVDAVKAKNGSFTFTLLGAAGSESSKGLQLLQQMYTQVGIDARIEMVEPATLIIRAVSGDYAAALAAGFFYNHPDTDLLFINPANVNPKGQMSVNFTRTVDPELTAHIDKFRSTLDPATQRQAMSDLVRQLNSNSAYIWLFHTQVGFVASRKLVNLTDYTLPDGAKGLDIKEGSHPMWQVWIKT